MLTIVETPVEWLGVTKQTVHRKYRKRIGRA
jgi:hypothetical protein